MLQLLAASYTTENRDRCSALFLEFHQLAFEALGHCTPPGQNALPELYAIVLGHIENQKSIFPKAFAAWTIRHEKHIAYRHRRYEIIKQLRLQQHPDNRDALLRNLKTIELRNAGNDGKRFPAKHTWLIENSAKYYTMWQTHFRTGRLHDRRICSKPVIHNTDLQQWSYVVGSKESIRVVDQQSGKFQVIMQVVW